MIKALFISGIIFLFSCNETAGTKKNKYDSPKNGYIHISVDESFKPVIEEEIKVYCSTYPDAKIIAEYKPEIECFKDLAKDSTRLIIVARGLTRTEEQYYKTNIEFIPPSDKVAYDAIAVITNKTSNDSIFSVEKLQNILLGKNSQIAVMDGAQSTGTVRFLKDSILKGNTFGANVVAAKGTDSVIEFVSKNISAIGFVGSGWVNDSYSSKQIKNLDKINIALVECIKCLEKNMYARPSQASITNGQYHLARPLWYIVKENYNGLGTGFTNFLSLERGQLIFRRSFFVPIKINFYKRTTKLN